MEERRADTLAHTHTQMRWEILEGGRFCGQIAHLVMAESRERERVKAEGDT